MLTSMTGFGKADSNTALGHLLIEIQSVNNRSLVIKTSSPKAFLSLDLAIKKEVGKRISRGSVFVSISFKPNEQASFAGLNVSLGKAYVKELSVFFKKVGLKPSHEQIATYLLAKDEVMQSAEPQIPSEKTILTQLKKALDDLVTLKKQEGVALTKDLLERIALIQKNLGKIKSLTKKQMHAIQDKLHRNLEELNTSSVEDERIAKEIALLADKADITEEIVRLDAHCTQATSMIKQKTKSSGKTLEFLSQEMLRETNTITQKTCLNEITMLCIDNKSQIEKIKEQLANVE